MKKVILGMSGGVDSSVAAFLLKEQGFHVIGVNIRFTNTEASDDYIKVCEKLGIEHHSAEYTGLFKDNVVEYFCNSYTTGETPNPCVICNRYVKWQALLDMAEKFNADYAATGHYAKVIQLEDTGRYTLKRADDSKKDQTYMLYNLSQKQLSKTIMPLGNYSKVEIRKIAENIELTVADKPDSQEICFIPDNDYASYILNNCEVKFNEGNFVDENGNIIGKHKGIVHYTVGQRKGLGMGFGKRLFVKSINPENNEVVLCDDENLYSRCLTARDVNFMAVASIDNPITAKAKIRYSQHMCDCTAVFKNNKLIVEFKEKQRAVTKGQAVVLYDETGDYLICGGIIE